MADKKISALTGATTPLAGTEVLPIVQSGATVKVAVSDLTAGRAMSALSLTTATVQATNSGGVALKNSGGTTQLSVGAGGGDNVTISVATNITPANAAVAISPTGTGTVAISPAGALTINPTAASTIDNTSIGATTASTGRFTGVESSGNLLVGVTSAISSGSTIQNLGASRQVLTLKGDDFGSYTQGIWSATTTGDNSFTYFGTETSLTVRGAITYNRTGGLTVYGTTSDYRAKDIIGPVLDSGAVIDSVPVYMGKMKGATQERPMFIAHETPAYAHTGVKNAVDADENPVYQQMDASALIPVMWAEIQDLRKRLAVLEAN
jgi:hypothetical protein